jgi:hypothetical protein
LKGDQSERPLEWWGCGYPGRSWGEGSSARLTVCTAYATTSSPSPAAQRQLSETLACRAGALLRCPRAVAWSASTACCLACRRIKSGCLVRCNQSDRYRLDMPARVAQPRLSAGTRADRPQRPCCGRGTESKAEGLEGVETFEHQPRRASSLSSARAAPVDCPVPLNWQSRVSP